MPRGLFQVAWQSILEAHRQIYQAMGVLEMYRYDL
jgi:hypothetical protein